MNKKPSPKPSSLEAHIGFWLRYVSNQVSSRFENQLEAHGVAVTEWIALRALYERPTTTYAELINALGMTKGAVSKVVTKLEAKGFASRSFADDSARDQVLALTVAGKKLVPKLSIVADDNDEFFFGHLSKIKRTELMNLMQELVLHHEFKEIPTK